MNIVISDHANDKLIINYSTGIDTCLNLGYPFNVMEGVKREGGGQHHARHVKKEKESPL